MVEYGNARLGLIGDDAQELFLKPILFDADIRNISRFMPMNRNSQKIAFLDTLEDILQLRDGCGWTPKGEFDLYERSITLTDVKINVPFCVDQLASTAFAEKLRPGSEVYNIDGTLYVSLIQKRIQQAIKKDTIRLSYWGNKLNPSSTFNLIDGLWTYIFDLVGKKLMPYQNINSGVALAPGDGIDIMRKLYKGASNILKDLAPNRKRILVSRNVFEQFEDDIEDGMAQSSEYAATVINGTTFFAYRGVPIVPMYEWVKYAQQSYPGQFKNENAKFAVYTALDNVLIGSDVTAQDTEFFIEYDSHSKKMRADGAFKLGFQYVHPELMCAAY